MTFSFPVLHLLAISCENFYSIWILYNEIQMTVMYFHIIEKCIYFHHYHINLISELAQILL